MAWTSAHFAMGMACGGGVVAAVGLLRPRLWRWMTPAMTLAGLWAILPDLPRLWREDFPSLPLSGLLGRRSLETGLHRVGDLFFFHGALDAQPKEYALHGLLAIVVFYNAAFVLQRWRRGRRPDPRRRPVPARGPTTAASDRPAAPQALPRPRSDLPTGAGP